MFDFVTHLWSGAQRGSGRIPLGLVPTAPENFPPSLPTPATERVRQVSGRSRRPSALSAGDAALVLALMAAPRSLSITELAGAMGCSVSESSKRVKAAGKLVRCKREGRSKLVKLREMTLPEWQHPAAEAKRAVIRNAP